MPLSISGKKFIITNYKVFGSYTRFSRAFRKEFKKRQLPTYKTYMRVIQKFESIGSVQDKPRTGAPKTATKDEKIEEIRLLIQDSPGISIMRVHFATGISVGSVHSIATGILNFYPYRIKILHQLKPPDFGRRKKIAESFLSSPTIAHYFISSDEAYFHLDGTVNNYNFSIWS